MTLLVVTGLFVTSFVQLLRVDPGFSADGVVAIEIAPADTPISRHDGARRSLRSNRPRSARELSSVASAAWTSALPLTGETWVDQIARIGDTRQGSQKPSANYRFIGPEYFRTLSMPVTKGRSIDERDRNARVVPAVISARAAQTVWPGEDADRPTVHPWRPDRAIRGGGRRRGRPSHGARGRIAADGLRAVLVQQRGQVGADGATLGEVTAVASELRRMIQPSTPKSRSLTRAAAPGCRQGARRAAAT